MNGFSQIGLLFINFGAPGNVNTVEFKEDGCYVTMTEGLVVRLYQPEAIIAMYSGLMEDAKVILPATERMLAAAHLLDIEEYDGPRPSRYPVQTLTRSSRINQVLDTGQRNTRNVRQATRMSTTGSYARQR